MTATRTIRTGGVIIRALIVLGAVVLIATSGISLPLGAALVAVLVAALFAPWSRLRRRPAGQPLRHRPGDAAARQARDDEEDRLGAERLRAALGLDDPDPLD